MRVPTREAMGIASLATISRLHPFSPSLSFLQSEDFKIFRCLARQQRSLGMHTTLSVIASSDSTSRSQFDFQRVGLKFGVFSADFRVHDECARYGAFRNRILWKKQKAFGDRFRERRLGSFRVSNSAGREGGGGTRGSNKGTEHVSKDHYRVLGLRRHATAPAIKTAYRQLARQALYLIVSCCKANIKALSDVHLQLETYEGSGQSAHVSCLYAPGTETVMTEVAGWSVQYHPDVNKDSDADNKFKSIRLAYEVLSNEASRKTYDNVLRDQANVLRQKQVFQQRDIRNKRYSKARPGHHYNRKNYTSVTYDAIDGDYSGFTMTYDDFIRGPGAAGFRQKDLDLDEDVNSKQSRQGTDSPRDLKIKWEKVSQELVLFVWVISAMWHALGAQTALSLLVGVISLWRDFAPGYRVASAVAWLVGGEKGLGLAVVIAITMRIFGKPYHTAAATLVLALWLGGEFLKAIPLPQGAILVMAYKCICLQSSCE